jgi:hypothetical protein
MKKIPILILSILSLLSVFPTFRSSATEETTTFKSPIIDTLYLNNDGAQSAKLMYFRNGEDFKYMLRGQNLNPGMPYTLVYYPGDEHNILCMGTAVPDKNGTLHLRNSVDIPSIPFENTINESRIYLVLNYQIFCDRKYMDLSYINSYLTSESLIYYSEI